MMRVVSPDALKSHEDEQRRMEQESKQSDHVVLSLASHIRDCWQAAQTVKRPIEDRLLDCLRSRKGEYDETTAARIKAQGGSDLYINLTSVKCRAAEAWLSDVMLPAGEKPWTIDATPIPELPPEYMQHVRRIIEGEAQKAIQSGQIDPNKAHEKQEKLIEAVLKEVREKADERAGQMEDQIEDDLVEGGWYKAFREILYDLTTYPAVFMKGPIVRRRKKLVWGQSGKPEVKAKLVREYERVSPFDIYPSPGSRDIQDGYLIERHRFNRGDLEALIGVDGFDEDAIRSVLNEYGDHGFQLSLLHDTTRDQLETDQESYILNPGKWIDTLEFWGNAQGKTLLEWGMSEEEVPDADLEYQITAWLVNHTVICARINAHPLGRRPYQSTSYEETVDSIWGGCPPEMMQDIQKICNSCGRSMANNMGIASGPQVWYDISQLPAGESVTEMYPWKMWGFMFDKATNRDPIGFFQPDPIIDTLLKLYDYFFKQASEVTGIPAYIYGSDSPNSGAGATASGLSMLMNAASKALRAVASNLDQNIIKESIRAHWEHIMLYEPERVQGGDIEIVARASDYLLQLEQLQVRRTEFLGATANPIDMEIIGKGGRAEILRETAKSLKMNTDRIVPPREQIEANEQEAQMQQAIQAVVGTLSKAMGIPPEQLMQVLQSGGGQQGPPGGIPQGPGGIPQGPQAMGPGQQLPAEGGANLFQQPAAA